MSERDALLRAILQHPDDDTPRLIFADWLDEHGEADRAEFIRAQCLIACVVGDRIAGEPLPQPPAGLTHCRDVNCLYPSQKHRNTWCNFCTARHREPELLKAHVLYAGKGYWHVWLPEALRPIRGVTMRVDAGDTLSILDGDGVWAQVGFARGFIDRVSLPRRAVAAHVSQALRVQPLRCIAVSDVPGLTFEIRHEPEATMAPWQLEALLVLFATDRHDGERYLTEPPLRLNRIAVFTDRDSLAVEFGRFSGLMLRELEDTAGVRWPAAYQLDREFQAFRDQQNREILRAIGVPPGVLQ